MINFFRLNFFVSSIRTNLIKLCRLIKIVNKLGHCRGSENDEAVLLGGFPAPSRGVGVGTPTREKSVMRYRIIKPSSQTPNPY